MARRWCAGRRVWVFFGGWGVGMGGGGGRTSLAKKEGHKRGKKPGGDGGIFVKERCRAALGRERESARSFFIRTTASRR